MGVFVWLILTTVTLKSFVFVGVYISWVGQSTNVIIARNIDSL